MTFSWTLHVVMSSSKSWLLYNPESAVKGLRSFVLISPQAIKRIPLSYFVMTDRGILINNNNLTKEGEKRKVIQIKYVYLLWCLPSCLFFQLITVQAPHCSSCSKIQIVSLYHASYLLQTLQKFPFDLE